MTCRADKSKPPQYPAKPRPRKSKVSQKQNNGSNFEEEAEYECMCGECRPGEQWRDNCRTKKLSTVVQCTLKWDARAVASTSKNTSTTRRQTDGKTVPVAQTLKDKSPFVRLFNVHHHHISSSTAVCVPLPENAYSPACFDAIWEVIHLYPLWSEPHPTSTGPHRISLFKLVNYAGLVLLEFCGPGDCPSGIAADHVTAGICLHCVSSPNQDNILSNRRCRRLRETEERGQEWGKGGE